MPKVSYERAREILGELLKEKNLTDIYFSLIECNKNPICRFVDKNLYEKGKNLLSDEFVWDDTIEGHEFWSHIYNNYVNKLCEKMEHPSLVDPFAKAKEPAKASCGLPHIEIGSNTWAFHQMVVEKKKLQHKDDDSDYYLCFKGGNHMEDNEGNDRDFDQLADYLDGWSIYEKEED